MDDIHRRVTVQCHRPILSAVWLSGRGPVNSICRSIRNQIESGPVRRCLVLALVAAPGYRTGYHSLDIGTSE